jgi:hypothetical protein
MSLTDGSPANGKSKVSDSEIDLMRMSVGQTVTMLTLVSVLGGERLYAAMRDEVKEDAAAARVCEQLIDFMKTSATQFERACE